MKRRLVGVAAAVLGTVLVSGVGLYSPAAAADPVPLSTVTLPLFGATLKLDITTGPGGALSKVEVTPAAGNTATKLDAHKVVFESANLTDPPGDPAKVVIKSRNGTQKISARAGSLTDFIGQPGGWSGDVFGDGAIGTVGFQIAGTDAAPTISGITATLAGAPAPVIGTVETSSGDDDDENEASARVRITFTNAAGDQSRILSIKVKVEADDGDSEAKLSISLGRIKGVAGKAAGPHTWTGLLCDNALATIPYTIDAAGAITLGTITPAGSTVSTDEGKTVVKFADRRACQHQGPWHRCGCTRCRSRRRSAATRPIRPPTSRPRSRVMMTEITATTTVTTTTAAMATTTAVVAMATATAVATTMATRQPLPRRPPLRSHSQAARLLFGGAGLLLIFGGCSDDGSPAVGSAVANSSPSVAPAPSTTLVAAPPATVGVVAPTLAPVDGAALLQQALTAIGGGYHFNQTATVDGGVVLTVDGDRLVDGTRLTLSGEGGVVSYIITPDASYAFSEGGEWEVLDADPEAVDPILALTAPTSVAVVSNDGTTVQLAVTVPATRLGVPGDGDAAVQASVVAGSLTSVSYATTLEDGRPAAVVAVIGTIVDPSPVVAPI